MGRSSLPLMVAAAALFALGGCMTADGDKVQPKRPDVTKLGVLPPPQETMRLASGGAPAGAAAGPVVPAGGIQPEPKAMPTLPVPSLAKITGRGEKLPATEFAVAWRNRIAHLPDPTRNGALRPGIVGQMFLYGGPQLQFCEPDGTLTVDLIDETPRPDGKPGATPERWQFSTEMLKNLRTTDETFGKSYVLFLPWPAYKSDITKVRIAARYDQTNGHTLYASPTAISLDAATPFGAPVWDGANRTLTPEMLKNMQPQPGSGGQPPGGAPPPEPLPKLDPIPLGGNTKAPITPIGGAIPLDGRSNPGPSNPPALHGAQPLTPNAPLPTGPLAPASPASVMPLAPATPNAPSAALPPGVPPIVMTVGKP